MNSQELEQRDDLIKNEKLQKPEDENQVTEPQKITNEDDYKQKEEDDPKQNNENKGD